MSTFARSAVKADLGRPNSHVGFGSSSPRRRLRLDVERSAGAVRSDGPGSLSQRALRNLALPASCGLPLHKSYVKTDAGEAQVHLPNRRVFMSQDDLISRPRNDASVNGVAIIVWRHTDPVPAAQADILSFGGPFVWFTGRTRLCGLDSLVRRHGREIAVPDGRDPLEPRVNHACELDQIIDLASTILPREPDGMIRR